MEMLLVTDMVSSTSKNTDQELGQVLTMQGVKYIKFKYLLARIGQVQVQESSRIGQVFLAFFIYLHIF